MNFGTCAAAAAGLAAAAKRAVFLKCGIAAAAAFLIAWSDGASAAPLIQAAAASGGHRDEGKDGDIDYSNQASTVVRLFGPWEQRGAMEFSLNPARTAIASGATFNSVHLALTGRSANTDDYLLQVFGFSGNGSFGAADYFAGSFLTSQVLDNAELNITIDVTEFVLDMLDASDTHAGFNLRPGQFGGFAQFLHGPDVGPRLVFDYTPPTQVPEPASLALFGLGLGLAGLASVRRRARR